MSRLKKLIDELCPDGVEHRKLGTFADCFSGATPSKKNSEHWVNVTIPWMSSGEIHQHVITHVGSRITTAGYDSCSTRLVPVGTVVVALAGQGKTRGTVAITAIELCTNQSIGAIICNCEVESKYLYYSQKPLVTNQRFVDSVCGERIMNRFLMYALVSATPKLLMQATTGTNAYISRNAFDECKLPIPQIDIQRQMAEELDCSYQNLNALRAERDARRKQFEYYRDKLLSFPEKAR